MAWRNNSENFNLSAVGPRSCIVSVSDPARRIEHSVEVSAETLYEAAAIGFTLLREGGWVDHPGPAAQLEIHVRLPAVTHEITIQQLRRWAESHAITPAEKLRKARIRRLLT
jgi:hypothetical protein